MSILLIGQKSVSHPKQFWWTKEQRLESNRLKKQKQMKYQVQLLQQIQQKKERKRRQKQQELWVDKKRELFVLKDLYKKYQRQPKYEFNQKSLANRSENLHNSIEMGQQYSLNFPSVYYRNNDYQSQYWRSFNKPIQPYFRLNYHKPRKIKTQNSVYQPYARDLALSSFIDNPEEREKELKQHENRRFKEVYELLDRSIDAFDGRYPEKYQPKTVDKLQKLDKRGTSQLQSADNLFQEEKNFYQLPFRSRKKPIRHSFIQNSNENDREWRAWYAKEKLKQLQQYLQNQQLKGQIQNKLLGDTNAQN